MPQERDPEGRERSYLNDFLHLPGAQVLEIGCGDGRMTRLYADLAATVIGVDPNLERVTGALAAPPPHAMFAQASAFGLPIRSGQFDSTILAWSL